MDSMTYSDNAIVLSEQTDGKHVRLEIRRQMFDRESLIQLAHDLEEIAWGLKDE